MRSFSSSLTFASLLALAGCEKNFLCYASFGQDQWCSAPADFMPPDEDGDGFDMTEDCDDSNADIFPGADNQPCTGIDWNCDGMTEDPRRWFDWFDDLDGDGFGDPSAPFDPCVTDAGVHNADDCDDTDPDINPSGVEIRADGIDQDCNGEDLEAEIPDADGDGFKADVDCDDDNPVINPDAEEVCDLLDNDCDDLVDDEDDSVTGGNKFSLDKDQDGFGSTSKANQTTACEAPDGYVAVSSDCDDSNSSVYPGAVETCTDTEDKNCDGLYGAEDNDGDSFFACQECDDSQFEVNPNATEVCDGVDNDCQGGIDDGVLITWYQDTDKDSYGSDSVTKDSCMAPAGYGPDGGDCDDSRPTVNPDGTEVCNDRDDDCNQVVDDGGVLVTFFKDADNDGFGDGTSTVEACTPPVGYVANANDCQDTSKNINPSASEVCDAVDNDCNGTVDVNATDAKTWYADADKDGYGGQTSTKSCAAPAGYLSTSTDCDDSLASVSPSGTEVCNGLDDNCNGKIDDGAKGSNTYYLDSDKDTFGDKTQSISKCSPDPGYVLDQTDCNDADKAVFPGATEVCNSKDDDCDGTADDGVKITFYVDNDKDNYGTSLSSTTACSAPAGYTADKTDCDDTTALRNPGNTEACDNLDNDCDTLVDEGVKSTFYKDGDTDTYGDSKSTTQACAAPAGYVASSTDCDDANQAVNPAATEVCNGVDDNCNVLIDDGAGATKYYADADADGYGDAAKNVTACSQPAGYTVGAGDCNDSLAAVNPGVTERPSSVWDDDCNGKAMDDGVAYGGTTSDTGPVIYTGPNLIQNQFGAESSYFPGGTKGNWVVHYSASGYTSSGLTVAPYTGTSAGGLNGLTVNALGVLVPSSPGFGATECVSLKSLTVLPSTKYGFSFVVRNTNSAAGNFVQVYNGAYWTSSSTLWEEQEAPPTASEMRVVGGLMTGSAQTALDLVICTGRWAAPGSLSHIWFGRASF